jgi:hypothetical protein
MGNSLTNIFIKSNKTMDWETSENLQHAVLKTIGERALPSKLLDAIQDHEVIKALCYNGPVNGIIIEKLAKTLLENKFCIHNDQKVSHLVANIRHIMMTIAQVKESQANQERQAAELRRMQNLRSSLPLKNTTSNAHA